MRRILILVACTAICSTLALAENWTGKLLDASCYDQQSKQKAAASCDATSNTSSFALQVSNQVYKLDAAGNSKAMTALKNRADRSAPGKSPSSITAKVEGTESGGMIKVEDIEVQ